MPQIKPVENVPAAFAEAFTRLNETIAAVNALLKMEGRGGIKVHVSEGNIVVEYNSDQNGTNGIAGGSGGGQTYISAFTLDTGASPPQVVPEPDDLVLAIENAYASATPQEGDVVLLRLSSTIKFSARVTQTDLSAYTSSGTSLFVLEFTVGGSTYYATVTQLGLF